MGVATMAGPSGLQDHSLRTALLSATRRTSTGELRAELELAGRSVLAWQVDAVRALGCERIICHSEATRSELLVVQQDVEARGGEFHLIRSNLQLTGLVRANDELVLLLDGLIPDRALLGGLVSENGVLVRQIATIPATHALAELHAEDFERIDRERHWAGLAIMRADQVHKLADLPADGDPMSMLLRLALQARVECSDWSGKGLSEERWLLADDARLLATRERSLVDASVPVQPLSTPFVALSAAIVRRLGPGGASLLPQASVAGGVALILLGLGAALAGWDVSGLILSALGVFAAMFGEQLAKLRSCIWAKPMGRFSGPWLQALTDALVVMVLAAAYWLTGPSIPALSLPLFFIGISFHLRGFGAIPFWDDRALQLVGFALAAALGYFGEVLVLFGLAALAHLLLRSRREGG